MARVYVVQNQHRWDHASQSFKPKFDFSSAEQYGELVSLLSPTAAPFRPEGFLPELHEKLAQMQPEDYLLLIGNPVLIGLTVAVAADFLDGRVQMLQWSGKDGRYLPIVADNIFAPEVDPLGQPTG